VVAFADGSRFSVPEAALVARPDGTYQVGLKDVIRIAQVPAGSGAAEELVVPVVAEELSVKKRQVARGGVRVRTRVETREQVIDESLLHEEVAVERVSVNKLVEGAAPTAREEEGVLVGTVPQPGLVGRRG
jgi:stress response protein YsnF